MRTFSYFMLTAFLLLFLACKNGNALKEAKFWKYSEGFYVGDFLDFNQKDIVVKNDTLYRRHSVIALVGNIDSRLGDKVLQLKDPKTGTTGTYVSK